MCQFVLVVIDRMWLAVAQVFLHGGIFALCSVHLAKLRVAAAVQTGPPNQSAS